MITQCTCFNNDRCPDNPKDCHRSENCAIINRTEKEDKNEIPPS